MMFDRDDPNLALFRPLIIAHDVGHSRDRSTAVVGGNSPFQPRLLGIKSPRSSHKGFMEPTRQRARGCRSPLPN